jgi:glycosyltransferase involved in cell wall biosynthesis
VSVIVVTRDRPRLLADALASVASQEPRPLEVRLAADDGGASLEALPALPLLEWTVRATHFGQPGAARNAAAEGARGEVLAFLDDDDRWRPGHLAGLADAFEDERVVFAWRDADVIRERVADSGERTDLETRRIARNWDDALMRRDDFLPPSAWAMRARRFRELGGFDPEFRFSEDWDLLLRLRASVTSPDTELRRVPGATTEVRLRESGVIRAWRGRS